MRPHHPDYNVNISVRNSKIKDKIDTFSDKAPGVLFKSAAGLTVASMVLQYALFRPLPREIGVPMAIGSAVTAALAVAAVIGAGITKLIKDNKIVALQRAENASAPPHLWAKYEDVKKVSTSQLDTMTEETRLKIISHRSQKNIGVTDINWQMVTSKSPHYQV